MKSDWLLIITSQKNGDEKKMWFFIFGAMGLAGIAAVVYLAARIHGRTDAGTGHTHGGQFFPINYVGEWTGENDKTYGLETRNLSDFIVTSGIADWAIKFKTGCRSEYVVIDIAQK